MKNVEVASFSVNKIKTLKYFSFCPRLSELYIRKNSLVSLDELQHLKNLPELRCLWIADNPCTNGVENYREQVLAILPQLNKLDNIGSEYFSVREHLCRINTSGD